MRETKPDKSAGLATLRMYPRAVGTKSVIRHSVRALQCVGVWSGSSDSLYLRFVGGQMESDVILIL